MPEGGDCWRLFLLRSWTAWRLPATCTTSSAAVRGPHLGGWGGGLLLPLPGLTFLTACYGLLSRLQRAKSSMLKVTCASNPCKIILTSLFRACPWLHVAGDAAPWPEFLQVAGTFLEQLLQMLVQVKHSLILNFRKILAFLSGCRAYMEAAAGTQREKRRPQGRQLLVLLVSLTTLCRALRPIV